MAFDIKLMEILACPVCKGKLAYDKVQNVLICNFDKVAYPIENDIPVLLENEAQKLSMETQKLSTEG